MADTSEILNKNVKLYFLFSTVNIFKNAVKVIGIKEIKHGKFYENPVIFS